MADSNELSFLCIGSLGTGFLESSLERGLAHDVPTSSAPTRAASTAVPTRWPAWRRAGPTPPTGGTSTC